jgi:hypothetical protein
MKFKLGDKVTLKKSYVKWSLEHLDMYCIGGDIDKSSYEELAIMFTAATTDKMPTGIIKGLGLEPNCYKVDFKLGKLRMFFYIEAKYISK